MPEGSLSYGIVSIHLVSLKFLMQRSVSLQTDCSILIMTGLPPQPQPPLGPVPIHLVLRALVTLLRLPLPHPFPLRWAPRRDIGRNACLSLAIETPHAAPGQACARPLQLLLLLPSSSTSSSTHSSLFQPLPFNHFSFILHLFVFQTSSFCSYSGSCFSSPSSEYSPLFRFLFLLSS